MKPKSFSRVVEVLKANGFEFIRCRGSHHHFHKPGKIMIVTVPFHGRNSMVSTGTIKSIARQAGIPEEEF